MLYLQLMLGAVVLATLVAVSDAPVALALEWDAPEGCPDRDALLAEVRRLRGAVIVRPPADSDVSATVSATRLGGRFVISVRTTSPNGTGARKLEAETCLQGVELAAVVLALALAPFGSQDAVAKPLAAAVTPPPAEAVRWQWGVALIAVVRLGPLPSVAPGVSLGVALWRNGLSLELQLGTSASQVLGTGMLQLPLVGALDGCGRLVAWLSACVELEVGWFRAEGRGLSQPMQGEAPWVAVAAVLRPQIALWGPLWLRADLVAGASLSRPRVVANDLLVFQPNLFAGRAGAGLELRW